MTRMLSDGDLNNIQLSEESRRILSLLGNLRADTDGQLLFDLVAQLLQDQDRIIREKESQFARLIDAIVQSGSDAALLPQRLNLLRTLGHHLPERVIDTLFNTGSSGAPVGIPPVANLQASDLKIPDPELTPGPAVTEPAAEVAAPRDAVGTVAPIPTDTPSQDTVEPDIDWDNTPEARQSERTSGELSRLRELLVSRMSATSDQYKDFSEILNTLLSDLQNAKNAEQLEALRNILKRKVRRMIKEHKSLSDNISMSSSEIQKFENKCQQLNRELGEAKQMSLTDELTGLPNRRAFLRRLANETGRVQRYGYPLAVAMLDLDLFKEINDTHGHETGDEVLRSYTEQVLSTFRNYDMVARYGGEEFAVLLPHTDGKGAERALNKVRKRATESTFSSDNQSHTLPTFSAGIAMYHPGEPPSALIDRADRAMYEAKRQGRNRVELLLD